ncbi:Nodulin homeobox [Zea mays]|uniref:Nodulin homeobox n=1 Tax=Zea mays TaxID=4577 RepID=A0A1D6F7W0_MAIZE|nr:Nodulin homeobox [Zea mays]
MNPFPIPLSGLRRRQGTKPERDGINRGSARLRIGFPHAMSSPCVSHHQQVRLRLRAASRLPAPDTASFAPPAPRRLRVAHAAMSAKAPLGVAPAEEGPGTPGQQAVLGEMVEDAAVWCAVHGLVVGDRANLRSGTVPGVGLVHAPFSLLPARFPVSFFNQACELAPIFNELVDRVSLDGEFLQAALSRQVLNSIHWILLVPITKQVDEFTSRLLEIHDKMMSINKKEVVQNDIPPESMDAMRPVQQHLPTQTSTPASKMNNLPKDAHNMEVSTPVPPINSEGNDEDETPKNTVSRNGGFLQNAVGQDLVHLGVARTASGGPSVVASGVSTGHQHNIMDLDERQPKRRKRALMNNEKIDELEKALVDEPEMHKNWSEKLSLSGPEITASQLKTGKTVLNIRKAKLARIAKERAENADKPSIPHPGESSESAGEDNYLPPAGVMTALSKGGSLLSPDSTEQTSQAELSPNTTMMVRPFTRSFSLEPGRLVSLVDSDGKEVGRGKIFQAPGKSTTKSCVCVVDVTELRTEKWRELPHPSEAFGWTFQEAEVRNGGIIRVSWDAVRLFPVA